MNDQRIKLGVYLSATNVAMAMAVAFVVGFTPLLAGKLYVVLTLNVFSLPLLLGDVFAFPGWVWYVIVYEWVGALVAVHEVTKSKMEAGE